MSDDEIDLTCINKINVWLRDGDVGTSATAIVTKLTGLNICKPDEMFAPADPSDLIRCIKLLLYVPEFKARLNEMSEVSPQWKCIIDNWVELEAMVLNEEPSGRAPKTYERMTYLLHPRKIPV